MSDIRDLVQAKLEEIQYLETTPEIPDSLLETGKTYFSYSLQKNYVGSDYDRNYTYRININGYIKRIQNDEENTLLIVDTISKQIEEKLKELNIKVSFNDVSIMDNIRKINVRGEAMFNEINNGII